MDFICLDQREEEPWEDRLLLLIKIRKELSFLVLLIRGSCLFVIGPPEVPISQAVRMIPSFNSGTNRGILDLSFLWILCQLIKILF